MNEIVYPMTLDYVPDWDAWAIVRELATNALDADPGFTMELNAEGALVIKSRGDNLAIRHLLFGVTQKDSPDAIGQFGEGLKLALLVLTRMGLTAHIYSGGRHLWNEPAEMEGEQVFKVVWKGGVQDTGQTVIGIPGWAEIEPDTYKERFVRPGDPRILYTDPFGRSILEEHLSNIYVKGVWVQRGGSYGSTYAFSYNLTGVDMNRDRGVIDIWKANCEIGKIWASVTDEELLGRFWQAAKDGRGERDSAMHGLPIANSAAMKCAFQDVFGTNTVIATDASMAREAEYRGADVLTRHTIGGASLADLAALLVGTDTEYVAEMEGADATHLPDKRLSDTQLRVLKMLRRLAKRVGVMGKVLAYVLPSDVTGQCYGDDVRVSVSLLEDAEKAIQTWLHEEAHRSYGTDDATARHAEAIAKVAAQVIVSYAMR